jgi:uncharacterized membrane protein
MPKAAAVQPNEWATTHDSSTPFDIGALNRVVLDYAQVELTLANRWYRRTALGRILAVAGFSCTIICLMVAVGLGFLMLAGGIEDGALPTVVRAGAGLSGCALLGFFVPWLLTPYRQWDRTLNGIAVMILAIAAVSLGAVLVRHWEYASKSVLAVPFILLAVFAVGVMVAHARLRTTEKPPVVSVESLSPRDVEILRKVRWRALRILRSRNVVAYKDFDGYDNASLDPAPSETADGKV